MSPPGGYHTMSAPSPAESTRNDLDVSLGIRSLHPKGLGREVGGGEMGCVDGA